VRVLDTAQRLRVAQEVEQGGAVLWMPVTGEGALVEITFLEEHQVGDLARRLEAARGAPDSEEPVAYTACMVPIKQPITEMGHMLELLSRRGSPMPAPMSRHRRRRGHGQPTFSEAATNVLLLRDESAGLRDTRSVLRDQEPIAIAASDGIMKRLALELPS
jgi:hypothetical protein